ncbi:MAG: CAP domain-containing protein [Bacteroidetes bacterium]|nr:MAG: CAP domain-containing protein [Bacteroidota bacterium]
MKYFLVMLLFCATSFQKKDEVTIDKKEAQDAFALLTDIRNDPDKYYEELNFEKGLTVSKIKLKWNDTLAKVAEAKAYDMAKRNYMGHVDPDGYGMNYYIKKSGYKLNPRWTVEKSANYFESLAANTFSGIESIKVLVTDKNTPSLGHRKHLLGLDPWNVALTDIGIGFSRRGSGSTYKTYTCIIIAKHD